MINSMSDMRKYQAAFDVEFRGFEGQGTPRTMLTSGPQL